MQSQCPSLNGVIQGRSIQGLPAIMFHSMLDSGVDLSFLCNHNLRPSRATNSSTDKRGTTVLHVCNQNWYLWPCCSDSPHLGCCSADTHQMASKANPPLPSPLTSVPPSASCTCLVCRGSGATDIELCSYCLLLKTQTLRYHCHLPTAVWTAVWTAAAYMQIPDTNLLEGSICALAKAKNEHSWVCRCNKRDAPKGKCLAWKQLACSASAPLFRHANADIAIDRGDVVSRCDTRVASHSQHCLHGTQAAYHMSDCMC